MTFSILPSDLQLYLLRFLDTTSLLNCRTVSKGMKLLASANIVWFDFVKGQTEIKFTDVVGSECFETFKNNFKIKILKHPELTYSTLTSISSNLGRILHVVKKIGVFYIVSKKSLTKYTGSKLVSYHFSSEKEIGSTVLKPAAISILGINAAQNFVFANENALYEVIEVDGKWQKNKIHEHQTSIFQFTSSSQRNEYLIMSHTLQNKNIYEFSFVYKGSRNCFESKSTQCNDFHTMDDMLLGSEHFFIVKRKLGNLDMKNIFSMPVKASHELEIFQLSDCTSIGTYMISSDTPDELHYSCKIYVEGSFLAIVDKNANMLFFRDYHEKQAQQINFDRPILDGIFLEKAFYFLTDTESADKYFVGIWDTTVSITENKDIKQISLPSVKPRSLSLINNEIHILDKKGLHSLNLQRNHPPQNRETGVFRNTLQKLFGM